MGTQTFKHDLVDYIVIVFTVTLLLVCGMLAGYDSAKEEIKVLTNKTQDQFWKIRGLEQHVKQYKADACTDVLIDVQVVKVRQ